MRGLAENFFIIVLGITLLIGERVQAQKLQASLMAPARTLLFTPDATGLEEGTERGKRETEEPAIGLQVMTSGRFFPGIVRLNEAPKASQGRPQVFSPSQPRQEKPKYPWKLDIVTTVFWIGELPTQNNPVPNTVSAWDKKWTSNFGGYDDPDPKSREGYLPKKFLPGQNPFYFALPYNDISRIGTKASAKNIPWYEEAFYRDGRTIVKGRWIAIRKGDKVCYAQWEDVGPFETDDWDYVFGDARPRTKGNKGAGLDVSPAVRDYLDFGDGYGTVDWRFVDEREVPEGPWKLLGANNPFANPSLVGDGPDWGLRSQELGVNLLARIDSDSVEK